MELVRIGCACLIGLVFAVSAVSKLRDRNRTDDRGAPVPLLDLAPRQGGRRRARGGSRVGAFLRLAGHTVAVRG
jgi:hypothetical protein